MDNRKAGNYSPASPTIIKDIEFRAVIKDCSKSLKYFVILVITLSLLRFIFITTSYKNNHIIHQNKNLCSYF